MRTMALMAILLAASLAACGQPVEEAPDASAPDLGEAPVAVEAEPPVEQDTTEAPEADAATEADAGEVQTVDADAETESESDAEPEEGAEVPQAAAKEEYQATDPTTVALAAGRPQLIKFYADW